jgi:hypothetical protein
MTILFHWVLLRIRNVSDKSCRKNQNTHFMFCNSFSKIVPLRDNVEKYGTGRQVTYDNIIWRMCFACWITKATNTHSEYVIIIAFRQQRLLRERAWILRLYVHSCPVWFCNLSLSLFNPLRMKHNPFYLKTKSVPRSKRLPPLLEKPITERWIGKNSMFFRRYIQNV